MCVHKMFEDAGLPQEMDLRGPGRETRAELGVREAGRSQCNPAVLVFAHCWIDCSTHVAVELHGVGAAWNFMA